MPGGETTPATPSSSAGESSGLVTLRTRFGSASGTSDRAIEFLLEWSEGVKMEAGARAKFGLNIFNPAAEIALKSSNSWPVYSGEDCDTGDHKASIP